MPNLLRLHDPQGGPFDRRPASWISALLSVCYTGFVSSLMQQKQTAGNFFALQKILAGDSSQSHDLTFAGQPACL